MIFEKGLLMTTAAFDTHRAAKIPTTAGFTNEQVDANIEVLMEVTNNLATKDDIESLLSQPKMMLSLTPLHQR